MTQTEIPFLFMRGGTSRGPYFNRADLPEDRDLLSQVLVSVIGSGHPINIDGIGGGSAVTTKVAILSRSNDQWADVDFFFAQVSVDDRHVDYSPTCGNILIGVGPAAIEMGLVPATDDLTEIRIRSVNTEARVIQKVHTQNGQVVYDGDTAIDGVPGTAAPVELRFLNVVGGVTGKMFPTGHRKEIINGIEVSCLDVAMPMVIALASSFGLTGQETAAELDSNHAFLDHMEATRLLAGERMGMGDVSNSVTPKFGLLSPAVAGGIVATRYFMPWRCHPSLAVTGSQCISACLLCPGTISDAMQLNLPPSPASIKLEHPMGTLDVRIDYRLDHNEFDVISAGLAQTARKLAQGTVFVPHDIWNPN
ncbi:MAG: 4-oxalomesaconate tautomerase [Paracoccaceae bacterium]